MTQTSKAWVGESVLRVEDEALLRGQGRFMDDLEPVPHARHAAIVRSPRWPTALNSASRASKQAGKSPCGSACAAAPPIVPRLRTCGSPICEAALVSSGTLFFSSSENSMSWWLVKAPIAMWPPSSRM